LKSLSGKAFSFKYLSVTVKGRNVGFNLHTDSIQANFGVMQGVDRKTPFIKTQSKIPSDRNDRQKGFS
jgi:hypothetical protein